MSASLKDNIVFGLYELLTEVLPGSILIGYLSFSNIINLNIILDHYPESLRAIVFLFISFLLGQIIHCISSEFEYRINKNKYGGYPSSKMLDDNNETFPIAFKTNIRTKVNEQFGYPIDSSSQEIFDIIYTYVAQNQVSDRVIIFLNMYTFSRNMVVTSIMGCLPLLYYYYQKNELIIMAFATINFISSFFFYSRFNRYAVSFAKEVYRSYYVNSV